MRSDQEVEATITELRAADAAYEAERTASADRLSSLQLNRELLMRRLAALDVSHRKIAGLTSLSHTRVNQILATGIVTVPFAHIPLGIGGPPQSLSEAVQRVMGSEARVWDTASVATVMEAQGWPTTGLREELKRMVEAGQALSVDGGGVTLHADVAARAA
jgi:hypothetical protein